MSNYSTAVALQLSSPGGKELTGLSPSPPGSGWDTCQTPVSSRAYRASGLPFRSDITEASLHGAGPGVRQGTSTQLQGRWVALRRPPPPPPKENSPSPPGSLEGGALPEALGESEPACPRQDHTQTARPQVSSCTWGWGKASSPALALLYPPLFSVLRTHRAAGQPQQTLR